MTKQTYFTSVNLQIKAYKLWLCLYTMYRVLA